MKIGYQGIEGSNSEEAAIQLALQGKYTDVQYIPLVTSLNVLTALKNKEIDYAVLAISNSICGVVSETSDAFKALNIENNLKCIDNYSLRIHHCLFVKNSQINMSQISAVASHPQALAQTKIHMQNHYPHILSLEIEDTAIGAERLSQSLIKDDIAVICRKKAGEKFNLHLIEENIEDSTSNYTEFNLYTLL